MVSVVHSLQPSSGEAETLARLCNGLAPDAAARAAAALALAREAYGEKLLGTGEDILQHALGMALIVASLDLDADARIAALLFAASDHVPDCAERLKVGFGDTVAGLVAGLHRLGSLRPLTRAAAGAGTGEGVTEATADIKAQAEILRKMLLAMVNDIRVVMLRLASRVQTLRFLNERPGAQRDEMARESQLIYAPLANRLGVWHVKWELEDLSFRYLEPETYKRIARMLDEKRSEREGFIDVAVARLQAEMAAVGVRAEIYGRPKHIFSIWNKMRGKDIDFAEVYDVRAVRIIVDEVKDCYTALGIVHHLWQPIHGEFDDYISHPKGNFYRSLHTAVEAEDGRSLEVQIRTREMHEHAELGVAAHWRYKESGKSVKASGAYEDKISWLRQLLSWRDEIADSAEWVQQFKRAALDDTIYVLTPQDKVIDLPRGATALDFAYRLHTDLGHRCRGAKIDGHMVPLNTALQNGQRVEIVTVKSGAPSRDWLNPAQGYLATSRARSKVKQWFAAQDEAELLAQGRSLVTRELQREGHTQSNLDELAVKLGLKSAEALFLAAARGEVGMRAVDVALRGGAEPLPPEPEIHTRKSRAGDSSILVVGVDKLLTQVGTCCKPMPPDAIIGFVTRGKGISIHRVECVNFRNMAARNPERVIGAGWGEQSGAVYPVDLVVDAGDRQGLLRDISDILSREKINVTAVKTQSRGGVAHMGFVVELSEKDILQRVLSLLREVPGVIRAERH
ncbi:MAG: bifunctional (p)ppGpp synthetase/guanosine-3',5'-bis(diphosphate) 3'-pyrophosphohydrolase [Sulfuritalea sp.]|nr:bifunctional (p)ppGpp synthetase/guanosine-3',5'-bis(diphosphate) 3'-pyrophosphohydrolase [Sulfuritalea sp.]MDP1983314.1 bifunctional (p)ppGpp synthetase/guanosine-3',5'-bis(diphosphate) 3'-pyrophosphohydrolase [Sulfuritalea sp.]